MQQAVYVSFIVGSSRGGTDDAFSLRNRVGKLSSLEWELPMLSCESHFVFHSDVD